MSSRSFAHASPARKAMALIVAVGLALGGCSTGADATVNGGTFQFTSPGGKTEFSYPAAERGAVGELSGPQVGDSTAVALSSFRGKVVVLNAWGAWCPECRAETDSLIVAAQLLQPLGARFLGLDVRDPHGDGAAYQNQQKIPYPSIEDPSMRTLLSLRGFPTGSIPATIALDQHHRVAHIWLGPVSDSQLVPVVKELLAES